MMRYLLFVLLLLVPILGCWTFIAAPGWDLWLPDERASTFAGGIDGLFYVILAPVTLTFVGTELVLAWAVFRFSSKKQSAKGTFTHGSHKLEMIWTAVPAVMLVILAFWQMGQWADMRFESGFPDGSKGKYTAENPVCEVWASQFDWRVRYPDVSDPANPDFNGIDVVEKAFEITVPADVPVVFNLHSRDVLHSFFVPDFRLKQDAVPGMTIPVWFQCEPGTYDLICAELCGWGHYKMAGRVRALPEAEFDAWLAAEREALYSNEADR